ncbi:aminopeptidase N [Jiangella asiatica]|uniref:Aminopeptidase N n=1 Tax=Jiangella asiatica TaxID=2530372 RepID=A0A4R5DLT1_9ACTN|nr:aminopeptidase N [Jiangella asiatica]TDE15069.1 aminopeptidase N [Jiangella asiatica]
MPGTNLTRDEAHERASVIDPSSVQYDVELDLTRGDTTFGSTTTARFTSTEGAGTWLDLIAPAVHEVVLNGNALDPADVFDGNRVRLDGLATENEVKIVADAAYMRTGEGLHRFVDPVDDEVYLYSQFEVADARRVYACFEQPDLKAAVTFTVDAPTHWEVVSNSPGHSRKHKEKRRWTFDATPVLSTYVTAIVAGPYHVVRSEYTGKEKTVPLALYCRKSLSEYLDADELFDVTRRGFAFFEEVFGLAYPFAKYDQLFVPEFNAGAMENAGAVTHHEDYLFRSRVTDAAYERRAETILHEMAHMWFGDLVTMRWWDDLWLNESFATWASVLSLAEATRWTDAWTTFAVTEKLWALRQDQLPSTHPISADIRDLEDVEVNFDGITYAKGASVLKQLVAWVGRDAFLEGVRAYFAEHAWGNTSLGDLFAHLERTSGRDLSEWNEQWLRTAGVNTLRPVVAVDGAGAYTSVAIEQTAPPEHPTIRSHRAAVGLYDRTEDGELVRRHRVELDLAGSRTEIEELRGEQQPDLLLVNDDDLTFAKVRLDDRSQQTVVRSIGALGSLPRALCWTASTDMLRDAELSASSFVELVLGGIQRETAMGVVQHVLASARAAIDLYAWPANRTVLASRWAAALRQLAGRAEPGGDRQLAFARAWVATAASDDHVGEIRTMLDGDESTLPGLVVDTDLRWTLLQRLVVLGAAGEDAIAAELERDNTAAGQRQAAYARASIPTYAAKASAWQATVESDELPNALLTATVRGFAHPEQRELVRPYIGPYLDAVPRVWAERTTESAQAIIVGLFPRVLADAPTASMVRSWLETAEVPDAARRLVVEGLADLERALRAQDRDRQAG